MNVALYARRLSDNVTAINGSSITPVKVMFLPANNNNFGFDTYPSDQNNILCSTAAYCTSITCYDIVKGESYTVLPEAFVGGRPPHGPHYS